MIREDSRVLPFSLISNVFLNFRFLWKKKKEKNPERIGQCILNNLRYIFVEISRDFLACVASKDQRDTNRTSARTPTWSKFCELEVAFRRTQHWLCLDGEKVDKSRRYYTRNETRLSSLSFRVCHAYSSPFFPFSIIPSFLSFPPSIFFLRGQTYRRAIRSIHFAVGRRIKYFVKKSRRASSSPFVNSPLYTTASPVIVAAPVPTRRANEVEKIKAAAGDH